MTGARKAAELLAPDPATFFVVSGNVETYPGAPRQAPKFPGSSLEFWRGMSRAGHDVQSHSVTHAHFRALSEHDQRRELRDSLALVRQIHDGPYLFCFPFNEIGDVDLREEGYAAGGFLTLGSNVGPVFHSLDESIEPSRLRSWAVRERHFEWIAQQLAEEVPDHSWVTLAFHSFDGEGHEPWTSSGFARLVTALRAAGYQIRSIRGMLPQLGLA